MTDLLQKIEGVYSDFRTKYGFLTRVINKAYNYLYHNETIDKDEVLGILNITKNWLANFVKENIEDKYSVFLSLVNCLCNALNKDKKTILDDYIKEYFYKTILNKYYTKNITDEEFSKLEIGELFRAFPKVYETLNGSSLVNYSKNEDYLKIRFSSVMPIANNKKRLKFYINNIDSYIENLLNKISTEVNENKKQELKRKLKYEIDNKYTFITPFPNSNIKNTSSGLYNFHTEEMKVIDIEMLNDNIYLTAEGEQEYNIGTIFVEQGSFLKVNSLKKKLMDNIVGGSLSSNLVSFRGVGITNIIKNPNTSYDAEEFNTLFDDRDVKVAKKFVLKGSNIYFFGDKVKISDINDSEFEKEERKKIKEYIFNNYKEWTVVAKQNENVIFYEDKPTMYFEEDNTLVIQGYGKIPIEQNEIVDELIFVKSDNVNYFIN